MDIIADKTLTAFLGARDPSGLSTFMSWSRLEEVLRRDGQIRPTEELIAIKLDDRGLNLRLRTKENTDG